MGIKQNVKMQQNLTVTLISIVDVAMRRNQIIMGLSILMRPANFGEIILAMKRNAATEKRVFKQSMSTNIHQRDMSPKAKLNARSKVHVNFMEKRNVAYGSIMMGLTEKRVALCC
eukprot:TRINITY_DN32120_c0_g1_i14.p2 TRINITY_DN32120_c0_g1~~TRINITY_DN32120_c0_g1_i14.p2  ORF type:complete len:115 (-),score=0.16 TRINITY_DN32120_c0_g1_i14:199-543(-)